MLREVLNGGIESLSMCGAGPGPADGRGIDIANVRVERPNKAKIVNFMLVSSIAGYLDVSRKIN